MSLVVEFVSLVDIPSAAHLIESKHKSSKTEAFVQSYVVLFDRTVESLRRVGNVVTTPKKYDCQNNAIFNSFRDYNIVPGKESFLKIEVFHHNNDPLNLLGHAEIPIESLNSGTRNFFPICTSENIMHPSKPTFELCLRRVILKDDQQPLVKTFFLVRHGESKWNEAQSKINIPGMFDRDHPLTDEGISQAAALNSKWRGVDKIISFESAEDLLDFDVTPAGSSRVAVPASASLSGHNSTVVNLLDMDMDGSPVVANPPVSRKSESNNLFLWDDLIVPVKADTIVPTTATATATAISKSSSFHNLDNINNFIATSSSGTAVASKEEVEEDDLLGISLSNERASSPCGGLGASATDSYKVFNSSSVEWASRSFSTPLIIEHGIASTAEVDPFFSSVPTNIQYPLESPESFLSRFLQADRIYSSPFTRAIETAIVALEGHPAMKEYGLTLCSLSDRNYTHNSNIREVKRIGGMDSVGVEIGHPGILNRVRGEISTALGVTRAAELIPANLPFDVNDADQPWWTPMTSYETEKDVQDRIRDFLSFVRYCEADKPIFVGHSLFFKAFYSKRVDASSMPENLVENLRRHRLRNASLLAVTVVFLDSVGSGEQSHRCDDGTCEALIVGAEVLCGGFVHQDMKPSTSSAALSTAIGEISSELPSIVSSGYSSSKQQAQQLLNKVHNNLQSDFDVSKKVIKDGVKKISGKLFEFFDK